MNVLKTISALILCFIAGTFYVNAQSNEFAPIGAKWHYDASAGLEIPQIYSTIESIKDTVIKGKNCRLLKQQFYREKNVLSSDPKRNYIIYSDSGIVYEWKDTAFTTLMNFNLSVGQSWRYKLKDGTSTELIVRKIDTLTVGSQKRKALQVRNIDEIFSTIIEGIGSTEAFTPEEEFNEEKIRTELLRCYQDSNISYQMHEEISCDTIFTGIKDRNFDNKNYLTISPNPFQDNININLKSSFNNNSGQLNISIYSLDGKKVFETNSATENINLNLSTLAKGIYTLRVKANNYFLNKTIVKL